MPTAIPCLKSKITRLAFCLLGLATACNLSAQSLSVGQIAAGNVFIYPALPQLPLTVDGTAVQWSVTDFWKRTVASGSLEVTNGSATLSFDPGAVGYFAVHLVAIKNAAASPEVIVTTAILPPPASPAASSPFGIATHFAQGWNPDLMDLIAKAGITRLRDENYWNEIERTQGSYLFPNRYTDYMAAAASKGIEPLMCLTFANSLYDGGNSPYTDAGRTGYANYSSEVVRHYGSQIKEVEIWNEYNGSFASGPAASMRPVSYTAMLKKTYETLRAIPPSVHPGVRIGGGAAVLVPLPWFENIFKEGALNYLDALVIHPYRGVPEGVETELAGLKALTRTYNNGVEKPIWVTECGVDSPDPGRQSMSRYMVRLMTLLRSEGVERASWYFLKDEYQFVTGLLYSDESSFGKNAPTTGYPTFATLNRILGDASIVGRETTDQRTRIYRFLKNGTELRVAWSTSENTVIRAYTSEPLVITDIMGNSRRVAPTNGFVSLTVNEDPLYISGNVTNLQEIGRDILAADGAGGYSESTQGSGPGSWQYGYEVGNGPFQFLVSTPTPYGNRWEGGYSPGSLRIDNGHPAAGYPSSGPIQVPTIRRWISNVSGPIIVHGYSRRSSAGGDGTGIAVRVDGRIIYSRIIAPTKSDVVNFTVRANVKVGSNVDFMINPGPGVDLSFDAIDYSLQISQPFAVDDPDGAPLADPDHDGVNNRLEAAFGSDPRVADATGNLPQLSSGIDSANQQYLHFQYRALQAPGDLTYQVVASSDLQNWTPASGNTFLLQNYLDGTSLLEFRSDVPITGSQSFLRLQVTE